MSLPALKRRKIEHGTKSAHPDPSVRTHGARKSTSKQEKEWVEDGSDSGDASLDDDEQSNHDNGIEDSESEENGMTAGRFVPQSPTALNKVAKPNRKRPDDVPQDGVYTAEVYKSNAFKLQIDELLQQVKPKYGKKEAPAELAMRNLKTIIERIPSRGPLSVCSSCVQLCGPITDYLSQIPDAENSLKASKIAIPFPSPLPPKDAKYKLQYERPSSINATGSYPLKIATRTDDELAIDLVVTMPGALFQEKDYLNFRYFYKRAFYLACVAEGIQSAKDHHFNVTYDRLNGNQLQPILLVRSVKDGSADDFSSSKCQIRVIPAIAEHTFPENKLRPTNNCIRTKHAEETSVHDKVDPTPFYNATVESDSAVTAYLKLLHASSTKSDAYRDACVLGRIWLRQRGFGGEICKGGFGNFEWAAMMALLLQPNLGPAPLSLGYSSYQLFKAALQFLANKDLMKTPYLFQASNITSPKNVPCPLLFDGPRNLNLLFKMTPWSYARLKQEAKLTVQMLGESGFDQFEPTFILKVASFNYRYDAVAELPIRSLALEQNSDKDTAMHQATQKIYSTLLTAFTDRVSTVSISIPEENDWPPMFASPPEIKNKSILVSLSTDPANANRTVDHGPAAENKIEAAKFRQFWGEKAELRRFKDGSIQETVVWSSKNTNTPILEQIMCFVVKRHIGIKAADQMKFSYDTFSHLITSARLYGQSGVIPFVPLMNAAAALEKDIRNLEGLPLQIRHFFAADAQLRYSSVRIPSSAAQPYMHTPASIVIQFEGSGRWPDDLSAIQRTKIAFLLKLAEILHSSKPNYTTRIGLENSSQPSQNQAYLDIILPSGQAFRLRIHHDREVTLLERQLKDKSLDGMSRETSAAALAVYKRNFLRIPAHTQAVQSLCTRFPALSPSIRLMKKWFASHLLMPHFAPELIELLVIRSFLQPHPWSVPSCATTGFLRTLEWISRWDWRHVPLIVDLSSSEANGIRSSGMKSEEISKIRTRFEAWRKIDPSLNRVVLFAATNNDTEGTTWTDGQRPEKVVAARMTALARAAVTVLKQEDERFSSLLSGKPETVKSSDALAPDTLFISQLGDYDFILHIDPSIPRVGKSSKSKYKNLQLQKDVQASSSIENVGYDPIESYINELQEIYADSVLWFWDPEALNIVAGIWNPVTTGQRAFKVKAGWNSLPLSSNDSDGDIAINKEATLQEIGRLGSGLVEKIDLMR